MRRSPMLALISLEDRSTPAAINFALTTATSILTLGGTVNGAAITQQGTGSLSTTYSGTVSTDVDFSSNTVEFLASGSAMKANNSGTWAPAVGGGTAFSAGSAPANYGGTVSVSGLPTRVAARGLVGVFSSTPLSLTGGPAFSFPSAQTLTLSAGTVDYNNFLLQGTTPLADQGGANSAGPATFTDLGNGNYSISLPSDATINDNSSGFDLILTISGTLNGTATLPVVDLNGAAAGFESNFTHTAGAAASKIAPAASITRSTPANLQSMTVTLAASPDGASESLAVDLTGTGLSTTGYNSLTGQLMITGTGTLAAYQSALQKVTYANSDANGTAGPRPVTVTVSDASNASLSRTANGTVSLPAVAATVTGVQVNDGSDQRSRVTSVSVTFDSIVTLPGTPAAAFQLVRNSDNAPVNLNASVNNSGSGTLVTLDFTGGPLDFGSLSDGTYTLTVLAAQVNGGNFDGNGDLTPGDNYTLVGNATNKLFRLFGDINGDGTVDGSTDFAQFGAVFGTSVAGSPFDFDANGVIDGSTDFAQLGARFGLTI